MHSADIIDSVKAIAPLFVLIYIIYISSINALQQDIMNVTDKQEFLMSCQILGATHFVATKLPSEKLVINHIFAIAFNGIMIIPTILLNGVAVITILKSSQLNSKLCYYIILLQSMFDLAVGVLGIPLFIFFLANSIGGISDCFAASLARRLMAAPMGGSSMVLTAMTVERYIAILHPYTYRIQVTKQRILKYVGATATVQFLVISLSFAIKPLVQLYAITKVTLIFILTAYVYTRIYLVVKKLACSQKKPHAAAEELNVTKNKLFLQEIRQARSCFIVVICYFMLGFLPPAFATLFSSNSNSFQELLTIVWVVSIIITNSSINSVIFFWTKTMLRKEALKLLNIK